MKITISKCPIHWRAYFDEYLAAQALKETLVIDVMRSFGQSPPEVYSRALCLMIFAKFVSVLSEFSLERARTSVTALAKYHGAEVEFLEE
jgi:hypothetical protein